MARHKEWVALVMVLHAEERRSGEFRSQAFLCKDARAWESCGPFLDSALLVNPKQTVL
jgi:hypothetical protein